MGKKLITGCHSSLQAMAPRNGRMLQGPPSHCSHWRWIQVPTRAQERVRCHHYRFFQLLKDALKEGGNLSTQGECLWLHLPLIKELRRTCKKLFPSVGYAFTTIPTCKPDKLLRGAAANIRPLWSDRYHRLLQGRGPRSRSAPTSCPQVPILQFGDPQGILRPPRIRSSHA
jgi:hypothetical protein